MKLSQDIEKVTIPGKKNAFRLYGGDGKSYVPITYFFFFFFFLIGSTHYHENL